MRAQEVALLRLAALRLVGERAATPGDAVRHLLCAQGQELPGALASIALRTAGGTRAAVVAALDAGEVVRSWPQRGTLHLVAADDLPWLLDLCAARVVRGTAGRQAQLGLDAAQVERARDAVVGALEGGRRLARAELLAVLDAAGLEPTGQRGAWLLSLLAMTGTLVLGPVAGREQQWVLLREWVPSARRLEGDEALGALALRYLRSHGPATAADVARWAGVTLGQARTGVALARPHLEAVDVDGVEHLLDPEVPDRLAAARAEARGVLLLPGFDELVLGYADRSTTVPAEHADRICPGGNGVFRPTVVAAGRAVGTWRPDGTAEPFTAFTPAVARAVPRVLAATAATRA